MWIEILISFLRWIITELLDRLTPDEVARTVGDQVKTATDRHIAKVDKASH